MEQAKGEHKKLFQEFCEKAFLDNDGSKKCTSKTISEEKAVRIKEVLKGKKLEVYTPSFRFWVNKTKKFELLNFPELGLEDVLCLPVKNKVR